MGIVRLYHFCDDRVSKTIKDFQKKGMIITKQYDIEEHKVSDGRKLNFKTERWQVIKCCKEHKRLPKESFLTTIIEYKVKEE